MKINKWMEVFEAKAALSNWVRLCTFECGRNVLFGRNANVGVGLGDNPFFLACEYGGGEFVVKLMGLVAGVMNSECLFEGCGHCVIGLAIQNEVNFENARSW